MLDIVKYVRNVKNVRLLDLYVEISSEKYF